jgi:hypothetical protein
LAERKVRKVFLGVVLLLGACTTLAYKDDIGFLVSAQAGSSEFPVYLNGKLCRDMEGLPGLCAKRLKSTEPLTFSFDAQSYSYSLNIRCTQGVDTIPPATVPSGEQYSFTLKAEAFAQFRSFTCIGEIFPQDRDSPISSQFEVRFSVVDARYLPREAIYLRDKDGKTGLVLGAHARTSHVFDEGKWKRYSKKTIVEIKGDPEQVKAYSESFAARFNYYNYD